MARTRTLTNLIGDVRERADIVNSQVVTDTNITRYLNESISDLYDLLISAQGQEFFLKTSSITTVSGTDTYTLPTDFFMLRGVDANVGSGAPIPLHPYMFNDRHYGRDVLTGNWGWNYDGRILYRTYGEAKVAGFDYNIRFTPIPDGVYTIDLWYIPHAPELSNGSDVWDGFNGWEEYAVVDAAIKCLEKQELDTQSLQIRLARLKQRIESLAAYRDAGFPERVQDVSWSGPQ